MKITDLKNGLPVMFREGIVVDLGNHGEARWDGGWKEGVLFVQSREADLPARCRKHSSSTKFWRKGDPCVVSAGKYEYRPDDINEDAETGNLLMMGENYLTEVRPLGRG
jgi:hypothetical protein